MDQTPSAEPSPPRLAATGVAKTYGAIRALSGVDLTIRPGELHGLVGQNGSGKSTLIKVFTGYHAPDPGADIRVDGVPVAVPITATERHKHGISVVHQSLGLVPEMTVTQNVRVETHDAGRWSRRISWRREAERTREALRRLGSGIDPLARVADLGVEERTTVAIARAMQHHEPGQGLIIFDESTRPLTKDALDRFYDVLGSVLDTGTSVLMISHRLEEVLQHTDRVSVLRDGTMVETGVPTAGLAERDLVSAMLGRQFETLSHAKPIGHETAAGGTDGVRIEGLRGRGVHGLSLAIRPGEIVGVTGLTGSGHEEVPYLLAGAHRARGGTLAVGGWSCALATSDIRTLIDHGVVLVPEDRAERGIALDLSIEQNITLPRHRTRGRALWTGRAWRSAEVARMIAVLDVRPPRGDAVVGTLSGGNQQKVLLAKWFAATPRLLLLHEPAQAVDVGARADIVRATFDMAATGTSVLVSASDPGDLAALCHRVIVLHEGRVVAELAGDLDQDAIVHATFAETAQARARKPAATPAGRSAS